MQYDSLAGAGSRLYFAVQTLRMLDPTYQFALDWFQDLFSATIIETTQSAHSADERLAVLIPSLARAII